MSDDQAVEDVSGDRRRHDVKNGKCMRSQQLRLSPQRRSLTRCLRDSSGPLMRACLRQAAQLAGVRSGVLNKSRASLKAWSVVSRSHQSVRCNCSYSTSGSHPRSSKRQTHKLICCLSPHANLISKLRIPQTVRVSCHLNSNVL